MESIHQLCPSCIVSYEAWLDTQAEVGVPEFTRTLITLAERVALAEIAFEGMVL